MIDPIEKGISQGWSHIDAAKLSSSKQLEADVVIVGTGAGGGIAAEELSKAGLKVIIVEMGALHTASSFNMEERRAYPNLYQESAARKTKDKAISILQGRAVGGSTTVNWTTSIRTPEPTQQYWREQFGVQLDDEYSLNPYFTKAEQRLNIHSWPVPPNENNHVLKDGCDKLGWQTTVIKRNVSGCANLGYCGMGCPLNAKQSMLVTTIPEALKNGATLVSNLYVDRLLWKNDHIQALVGVPLDQQHQRQRNIELVITAKQFVIAAGAIGTPAILMHSHIPDLSGRLGKHTYLHPSVISGAIFDKDINAHSGAPQSIYSDEFVWKHGVASNDTGSNDSLKAGYKLEVPPMHPVLVSSNLMGHGASHFALMQRFNQMQATIALLRDGFHPQAQGGTVEINRYGDPVLDYQLNEFHWNGFRDAYLSMAELQFAAGAKQVFPMHKQVDKPFTSWKQAKQAIGNFQFSSRQAKVASAHVMGGCNMGSDSKSSVVDSFGLHHQIANLRVIDGSVLPTSLGANPQLTIYALAYRSIEQMLKQITG